MARQMKFAEFRQKLEARQLSREDLQDYLEIDPTALRVRVRFRPGVLEDTPPPEYDVDEALYRHQRALDLAGEKTAARRGAPRVVADGDSWFRLPQIIWPKAIATRIGENGRFRVRNIAKWGDTLRDILARKEYLSAIESFDPAWCVLSAGGNDIQDALGRRTLLLDYDPARPLEQSITEAGENLLAEIGTGYRTLLGDLASRYPKLPIICHGYDYPRPEVGSGRYIGRHLKAQAYPPATMRPLVEIILNRLNEVIDKAVSAFPNNAFIKCLHVTEPYTWFDDMHPANDGFTALAASFEARMTKRRVRPRAARKGSRRKRQTARGRASGAKRRVAAKQ
jgi:lysophospholipase L1-like esterase